MIINTIVLMTIDHLDKRSATQCHIDVMLTLFNVLQPIVKPTDFFSYTIIITHARFTMKN